MRTGAVQRRHHGRRTRGSNQGAAVVDGNDNVNAVVKKKRTNQRKGPPRVRGKNTSVKAKILAHYLVGNDKDKASYLPDGFSYGFHVESEGLVGI